jgi:glycosyltransferase involved in cell wall biosynthesis
MKKTITVAAYNRPELLAKLLQSLKEQMRPPSDYTLYIRIDAGGDRFRDVKRVAFGVNFMAADVFYPQQNEGCIMNTFKLMEQAFEREGTDWNVYLEDDLLLSPDAFNLVEWYIAHAGEIKATKGTQDIGAYCLCRLRESGDPEKVYLSRAFVGWGFLMDARQWQIYAKPAWCSAKRLWGYDRMWDNSVADYIRTCGATVFNAFPELSRITNTGRVGTHFTAQKYDQLMQNHKYNQSRKVYDYKLVT